MSVYDGKRITKRKALDDKAGRKPNPAKKTCTFNVAPEYTLQGFPWDSVNYSCAYNSLLTILYTVYEDCTEAWKNQVSPSNQRLAMVG